MGTIYRVIYVRKRPRRGVFEIKRRLADRLYTSIIKIERNNTCEKCKTKHPPDSKGLHISHYFTRAREPVRFDRRNTDLLCMACHLFFTHHRAEYTKWKRKHLGFENYNALLIQAKLPFNKARIKLLDKHRVITFRKRLLTLSR